MQLENIYNQVPASTCPPGCGKCCGPVFPALREITRIKNWCTSQGIEYKPFMNGEMDCPYLLEDKTCQIYPVRPFMCRTFGVCEEKMLSCPMCRPQSILKNKSLEFLYGKTYQGETERIQRHRAELFYHYRDILVANGVWEKEENRAGKH